MPARDHTPNGAPIWADLLTSDIERSRAFYSQLFGWEASEPNEEFGGYVSFANGGGLRIGGAMSREPENPTPDGWTVYLSTDDAHKTLESAAAHGGQVFVEPMQVGDMGTMAVLADAGGAAVGVWQPGTHTGFGVLTEAGAPSWFELHTRDYDAAVAFYRDVFHWETHVESDTPEFRYTIQQDGAAQLAGIMDATNYLPANVPAHWVLYFGVDDTDEAIAKVIELGGSVVQPADDTPYGRIAAVTDATGAHFRLVAPNAAMPARA